MIYNPQKFKVLCAADSRVTKDATKLKEQFAIVRAYFVDCIDYGEAAALMDTTIHSGGHVCDFRHQIDQAAIKAFEECFNV